jgi:transketolase
MSNNATRKEVSTAPTPQLIGTSGDSLREAFGKSLSTLADEYPQLVVLDADIAGGTGVHHFRTSHPDRFFQFGIAEQNMMAAAAGMASTGLLPVVSAFAVFCLRGYEQARLSIAYTERNVKIVASHPGLDVGPDGGSAQCLEDLAAFRAIPNMTVISPADPTEMAQATRAILDFEGPVYMRTGRSPSPTILPPGHQFEIGKASIVRSGRDATIVACGAQVARACEASDMLRAEGIQARVMNMSTIKPIDSTALQICAVETGCFVTTEDHNKHGGLGSAVAESLAASTPCPVESVAVQDMFGESGEPEELAERYQITAPYIAGAVRRAVARKENTSRKGF